MLDYSFLAILESYRKQYQNFPLPVILCDRAFKVYWSNSQAKRACPAMTESAGLSALFAEYDCDALLAEVERAGSCTIAGAVSLTDLDMVLLPVLLGDVVEGVVILLMHAGARLGAGATYRSSRTADALNHTIRSTVQDMFDAMDTASAKASLFHAGWINQSLNRIGVSAYRVLRMAENLSTFARFQAGAADVTLRWLNLADLLREPVDVLEEMGRAVGVPVHLRCPEESCPIAGDRPTLELAFFNLIHNSLYFSRPGNRVEIAAERVDGNTQITVSDQGLGIPPSALPEVWRPYFAYAHQGQDTGMGLGLSVVKAVAAAHNAAVVLRSEEGVGTTVTLRFPQPSAGTPLGLSQETGRSWVTDRFARVYTGLSDVVDSPYLEQ